MVLRKLYPQAIRWFLSLYTAGFLLYHSLPVAYFPVINYSASPEAPLLNYKRCSFVAGVKTYENWHLGNPKKLKTILQQRGVDFYMDVQKGVSYKDFVPFKLLSYLTFEYAPKVLLGKTPSDLYSLEYGRCSILLSDMPIIFSFLGWDFPSYSFILGSRRNVYYSEVCQPSEEAIEEAFPSTTDRRVDVYVFSKKGFYFNNSTIKEESFLVANVPKEKVLMVLEKDDKVLGVFQQTNIKEPIVSKGNYRLTIYTYEFRFWNFYFGLRFLSCFNLYMI
ncbi:hypothetical protein [Thermocrinis minervae]|uniref:Uncharacterized protein n=1 Tax=Thermocrinis minervae TaxID=381751 RepID=A0A1M6RXV5_9AQUI|nr:hypothetical protein [Thermocrinis minervae]SHK37168.1 hypothetical protein SAMN05444391_0803 [Thermocrinis minervae]